MLTAGKIRLLLALAIVAAIAWLMVVSMNKFSSHGQSSSRAISDGERQADLTLRGMRVHEISNGSSRWTLIAEKAEYDTKSSRVKLADVRLSVAPVDKSLGELVLNSPTATYHTGTKDVYLAGGVKAKSSRGMEFAASSVHFVGKRGVVTTSDPVRFTDDELMLEGKGMEYIVATSAFKVMRDVTATYKAGKLP
ncbi:lipopolysaccharide-assembly, LptC-related [Geobacter sp. OR-1]|uniref:LPS export ABC transporter periplasmic protein LptC n=1 Tax=Geobacter sp. OR-1 TaxID=1266765 RepID=UPI00054344C4|nr:LPS export ABC transporter periplasmic protein LptC [Geobacter sp. OR-1]GAM08794.1 lipopolysaccharide-assembly, LptC-related [Geobacter sp. OR-1]